MLLTQCLELDDEIMVKVLYDVNVRLVNVVLLDGNVRYPRRILLLADRVVTQLLRQCARDRPSS